MGLLELGLRGFLDLKSRMETFMSDKFSTLEKEVMNELLLRGPTDVSAQIQRQYECSKVARRRITGVGFFTYFDVPSTAAPIEPANIEFGNLNALLEGTQNGCGFVLFIRKGKIEFLEGFTYGEPWPKDAKITRFIS